MLRFPAGVLALLVAAAASAAEPGLAERRRRAQELVSAWDYEAAKPVLDALARDYPRAPEPLVDRAVVADATGERDLAIGLLSRARALGPDVPTRRRIAALYRELDLPQPAREVM